MADFEAFVRQNFTLLFFVAAAWVAFWILASLAYRVWRRKPLFVHPVHDALFTEGWASGHSDKNILTKLGGARNCLHITLTPSELQMRPHFPFTLLFLPEIYDLELRIPRSHIKSVERMRKFRKDVLHVSFGAPGEAVRSIQLLLRRPQEFLDALR
jgi:hypothetical protein